MSSHTHPFLQRPLKPGWAVATVDEVKAPERHSCVAGPFGSSISAKFFVERGVPIIRGSNLSSGLDRFVTTDFAYISQETAARFTAQTVRSGDLVFTCWGTIGQVGLIPEKGPFSAYVISNKQLKLKVDRSIVEPLYAYYFFASPESVQYIRDRAIGSAVPGINLGILKALPILVPPIDTQKRIVSVLGAYDDLIEVNRRRVAVLEEMARGLFEEWFVRFRFPGHETVRIVDTPDGPLPEGWRLVDLGDVADINGASLKPTKAPETIGYIDIASVSPGQIDKISWMAFEDAPGRARRLVKDGSILWSNVRPNRRSHALVLSPEPDTVASTGFTVLDATVVPFPYLYLWLTTDSFVGYLVGNATGAAYPAVTAATFDRASVLLPDMPLAERFGVIAEPLYREAEVLRRANSHLAASRDLLLPRLISGQLSVDAAERHLEEAA